MDRMNTRASFLRTQRNLTHFDFDLTSGLSGTVISSPGDFFYIDQSSTGIVSIEPQCEQSVNLSPLLMAAGASCEVEFAALKISAVAQSAKTVRIFVCNGARIKGGGNVNPANNQIGVTEAIAPNCQFAVDSRNPGVGTTVTNLIAASANTKGIIFRTASYLALTGAAGTLQSSIFAAKTAPTGILAKTECVEIFGVYIPSLATVYQRQGDILNRQIPPGWGVWIVDNVGAAITTRAAYMSYEITT